MMIQNGKISSLPLKSPRERQRQFKQSPPKLEHEPRSRQKHQAGNDCALDASQNGLSLPAGC
jgi:hypothetical protein